MLKTPLCELLGIEKPVFQGGMAWIADASLASAVSEAGGLGIIAAMNADANWLRDQIHELRTKTDKPFGVNVMLMSPFADEVAQVVIDEQVPVVVTGAGNPTKYMKAWNDAGIKVIPVVASVALARLVARRGATAVVAEGTESGGHIGETSTMALVPQVVDAVDIPVVAAGGIADGRGVAAAFMLGAAGVQVGTRFLVADECTVSEQYKELVLKAGDTSTRATGRSTGHPVRALKGRSTGHPVRAPRAPSPTRMPRTRRRAQAPRSSGPWARARFVKPQRTVITKRVRICADRLLAWSTNARAHAKSSTIWSRVPSAS